MIDNKYMDSGFEWKVLAALKEPKNYDHIYKMSDALFTNERVPVFEAMKTAFMSYGDIAYESIARCLKKDVPTQLDIPQNVSIDAAIEELQRLAIKRQLKEKASSIAALAEQHEPSLDSIHAELEFQPILTEDDSSLTPGVQRFLSELNHKMTGKYEFVSTGFPNLDLYLGGEWKRKGLTVIGALPGTGKTALAFCSMLKMSVPSLMINLEMAKEEIIQRGVSNLTGIDNDFLTIGAINQDQVTLVEEKTNYINNLPLYIIDTPGLNVTQIIGHIKEHVKKGVRVVFIDHLQIIAWSGEGTENDALGKIAWALKECAKKLDIAVILLSQLTHKDGTYHTRGSGEVESKSDVFMFMLAEDTSADVRTIILKFKKNRGGRIGEVPMLYHSTVLRFSDGT